MKKSDYTGFIFLYLCQQWSVEKNQLGEPFFQTSFHDKHFSDQEREREREGGEGIGFELVKI